jgi:hypothetical protein
MKCKRESKTRKYFSSFSYELGSRTRAKRAKEGRTARSPCALAFIEGRHP